MSGSIRIDVYHHLDFGMDIVDGLAAKIVARLQPITDKLQQEITQVSDTLSGQLAAADERTMAALNAMQTTITKVNDDVTRQAAQIQALLESMNAGGTVTQEMVDRATTIAALAESMQTQLSAVDDKTPEPAPEPEPEPQPQPEPAPENPTP